MHQTFCLDFCKYLLWLCQYSHILPISFRDQWTCAQKKWHITFVLCTILATTKKVNDGEIHSSLPIDLGERKEKEEKWMLCDHLTHRHNWYMPFTPYTSVLCPFWSAYCTQSPLQSILLDSETCSYFEQIP